MTALGCSMRAALAGALSMTLAPAGALACACGCGVFDVGGISLPMQSDTGFSAWFRYSYMDQDQNWEGSHRASAADNTDKDLKTSFYTVGGEYMINRSWTVMAELPIYQRSYTTIDDGSVFGHAGSPYTADLTSLGDLQVMGTYTGFSPDLSSGVTFGVKLPTGRWRSPIGPYGGAEYDRDTMPGTGSTDLMVGGYHFGNLTKDARASWFVQGRYQFAVATQDDYRPGNELDAAVGVTYDAKHFGRDGDVSPTLQILDSWRVHDTGAASDPLNTGYERVLLAPGVNVRLNRHLLLYADVEIPIYQHLNAAPSPLITGTSGQLAAPALVKAQINYNF